LKQSLIEACQFSWLSSVDHEGFFPSIINQFFDIFKRIKFYFAYTSNLSYHKYFANI